MVVIWGVLRRGVRGDGLTRWIFSLYDSFLFWRGLLRQREGEIRRAFGKYGLRV